MTALRITRRLSRTQIVDAALRLSAGGNLEALSMRALADALGVTPMALYRHVADKDEIMLAVTGVRLEEQQLPSPNLDWRTYLYELAACLRDLLRSDPGVLGLFSRRPVTVPAAKARLEAAVDVLTRAGFGSNEAVRAYATVHTYTLGFCGLEAARGQDGAIDAAEDQRSAEIATFVSRAQFEDGLKTIIEGLAGRFREPQKPRSITGSSGG